MRHDPDFHRLFRGRPTHRRRDRRAAAPVLAAVVLVGLTIGAWAAVAPDADPPARSVRFGLCHVGGGENCVVDGDTFRIAGEKVRIADIDTPETHAPRCAMEAELGDRATQRLRQLLNAGPIMLAAADRATDRYGRRLATVMRDGRSLGDTLVAEGLARPWEGRRRPWCA